MLSDVHLGIYNDSETWHNVAIILFEEVCDYCIRNNIDTLLLLGDFFHNRKSTNTKTQHAAHKIAKIISPLKTYIIVGNHDCYFKNKIIPNSLELFKKYNHINIIEETTIIDDMSLVPWLGELKKSKYCFGHFAINGFNMNDNYTCGDGVESTKFKSYKSVFSGHFHTPSKQKNITYLGSPFQQTFNDINGKRGYYIFDNGDSHFIEFTKYPHFIKLNAGDKITDDISGNIIRLIFTEDFGENKNQMIVDKITDRNPLQLHVDFKISGNDNDQRQEEMDIGILDHDKVIKEYTKNYDLPKYISRKVLIKMMLKIKEEAYGL